MEDNTTDMNRLHSNLTPSPMSLDDIHSRYDMTGFEGWSGADNR